MELEEPEQEPLLVAPAGPAASSARSLTESRRRRRRGVTRENIRRLGPQRTPRTAELLASLWDGGAEESRRRAARYRAILGTTHDPLDPFPPARETLAVEEIHLGLALRCTRTQARAAIREAHRIDRLLPRTLARLERGELPSAWFDKVLERTRTLEDESLQVLDAELDEVDLGVAPESFARTLGHLLVKIASRTALPAQELPENRRRVVLDPPRPDGTGCLRVIGPIPEILDLSRRLDAAAHSVQEARRHAFEDGTDIPLDPRGEIAATGMLPSMARTAYDVLLGTAFGAAGGEAPGPRIRLNVTVPVMTLMGQSDAPGMLDGTIPVPAEMARELAAGEETWYRVLTDAGSGRFLPCPAETYRAPLPLREHLLLRHPTCTIPGCCRPSVALSETDHLEEYNHDDPHAGGRTESANLQVLCREHHRLKTLGLLDPVRDDDAGTTWWNVSGMLLAAQEDGRDLATAQVVAEMTAAWEQHQAMRRARDERAERRRWVRERGLSPGEMVTGPDGREDWWVGPGGDLNPPCEPPPY